MPTLFDSDEQENARLKHSHDGGHDDLGTSDDQRRAEIADLENNFATPPAAPEAKGGSQGNLENQESAAAKSDTPASSDDPQTPFNFRQEVARRAVGRGINFFGSRNKYALAGVAGGGFVSFLIILVIIVMFLAPFKTVHFATLLRSAGFARFNMYMRDIYSRTLFDAAVMTDSSTGKFKLQDRSLGDKLRGVNPEKQLTKLGEEGTVKFQFSGTSKWGGLKKTNTFEGIEINGRMYSLNTTAGDLGYTKPYNQLSQREQWKVESTFSDQIKSDIYDRLALENRAFRSSVYDGFRQAAGISMSKWVNKAKDFAGKSPKDARKMDVEETVSSVKGAATAPQPPGPLEESVQDKQKEDLAIAEGTEQAPTKRLPTKYENALKISKNVSLVSFATTTACMVHSLDNSFKDAAAQREQMAARLGADALTAGDQIKAGDVQLEAVNAENDRWTGADQSALYKQDTGESLTTADQEQAATIPSIKPVSQFANVIDFINSLVESMMLGGPGIGTLLAKIPGVSFIAHKETNYACDVVLNPYVQGGIAVGEITVSVASLGTTEGIAQGVKAGIFGALKLGGSVGVGEALGVMIDKTVSNYSGDEFSGTETGASLYNDSRVGVDYISQTGNRQLAYGAPMTAAETIQSQQVAMNEVRTEANQGSVTERYFALSNPFSLTSSVLTSIPTSFASLALGVQGSFAHVGSLLASPLRLASSFEGFLPHAFADATTATSQYAGTDFGVDEWGWTQQQRQQIHDDPQYSWQNLSDFVEPQLDSLNSKYQPCYSYELQSEKPSQCTADFLNTPEAIKWRLYMAESTSAVELGRSMDSYNTDDTSSTTTTTASSDATTCDAGTDKGQATGWENGQQQSIHLCEVQGITVNAQIAKGLDSLLTDAKSAGITMSGDGYVSHDEQQQKRVANGCPNPSTPASSCKTPTAQPGYSDHEMGLAIDFTVNNSTIQPGSKEFNWLSTNASKYGLKNLPSEAWHWSVDGQ